MRLPLGFLLTFEISDGQKLQQCKAGSAVSRSWPKLAVVEVEEPAYDLTGFIRVHTNQCVTPENANLLARNRAILVRSALEEISPAAHEWIKRLMISRNEARAAHLKKLAEEVAAKNAKKQPSKTVKTALRLREQPDLLKPEMPSKFPRRVIERDGLREISLSKGIVQPLPLKWFKTTVTTPLRNPITGQKVDSLVLSHGEILVHCHLNDADVERMTGAKLPFALRTSGGGGTDVLVGGTGAKKLGTLLCDHERKTRKLDSTDTKIDPIYLSSAGLVISFEYQISLAWAFSNQPVSGQSRLYLSHSRGLLLPTAKAQDTCVRQLEALEVTAATPKTLRWVEPLWCAGEPGNWRRPIKAIGLDVKSVRFELLAKIRKYFEKTLDQPLVGGRPPLQRPSGKQMLSPRQTALRELRSALLEEGCEIGGMLSHLQTWANGSKGSSLRGSAPAEMDWCIELDRINAKAPPPLEPLLFGIEWTGLIPASTVVIAQKSVKNYISASLKSWRCEGGRWREMSISPWRSWISIAKPTSMLLEMWQRCERTRNTRRAFAGHFLDLSILPDWSQNLADLLAAPLG